MILLAIDLGKNVNEHSRSANVKCLVRQEEILFAVHGYKGEKPCQMNHFL